MKYKVFDSYGREEGEPIYRACWQCNEAHPPRKDVEYLHYCFWCKRFWIFGHYLDEFETVEELDAFLRPRLEHIE